MGELIFFGSGSEWFWSMVSGLLVAVTFIVIYRQLRAQAAANAFQRIETVNGRWTSSEVVLARLEVALALRDGTLDADDTRVDVILVFFELLRDLHREGYLTDAEIARTFGSTVLVWQRLLKPVVEEHRAEESDPEMWSGTDELVATVVGFDRRRGVDRAGTIRSIPLDKLLSSVIRRETGRLRLMRDAGAGAIPRITPVEVDS
jgi:hypothetical protein